MCRYYAAELVGLESGPTELRPVTVDVAITAFSDCLSQCRIKMQARESEQSLLMACSKSDEKC
jgi:hypothetical protein